MASVVSVLLSARYPHSLCLFFDFPLRGLVASRRLGARATLCHREAVSFPKLSGLESFAGFHVFFDHHEERNGQPAVRLA